MADYELVMLDAVGIQRYIFNSNVLRENIGASDLVRQATRVWPFEIARDLGRTNVKPARSVTGRVDDLDPSLQIERDHLDAEILYAWGGNVVALFAADRGTDSPATRYLQALSRKVLEYAPGLELAVIRRRFIWDDQNLPAKDIRPLKDVVTEVRAELAEKKLHRLASTPLWGVGTTVACQSTGLPAIVTDDLEPDLKPAEEPARPISAEILAKLRHLDSANRYLNEQFPQFQEAGLSVPHDFDHFGRDEGVQSYIAVVHADGNGMGHRIDQLRADPELAPHRKYIEAMRDYVKAVDAVAHQALEHLSTLLLRHWSPEHDAIIGRWRDAAGEWRELTERSVSFTRIKSQLYVPFRPIAYGGDDLTFVCDGRLGLTLAAAYLAEFEAAAAEHQNPYFKDARACAGVSVVKTHYPFARAYDLAVELCRNAKEKIGRDHASLDWHFAASGLSGSLDVIRERQYRLPDSRLETRPVAHRDQLLEMRPIPLRAGVHAWRAWPDFSRVILEFAVGEDWRNKHNKVIALQEALRAGGQAVERFRNAYGLQALPPYAADSDLLGRTGWSADRDGPWPVQRCAYFDPIEALDFFVPLEG